MSPAHPDRFFDRDLSALAFHERVLAEAMEASNPLLERLKFTGIVSSNLDEFFMVRVAGYDPADPKLLPVLRRARALMDRQQEHFIEVLVPELAAAGLTRLSPEACEPEQLDVLRQRFEKEIAPVLTPIALSPKEPIPVLANLRMHALFSLETQPSDGAVRYAVVEIPAALPRFLFLPAQKGHPFVLVEDVVAFFAVELFQGYAIAEKAFLRLTRGAEISWNEEKDEDFSKVMTDALRQRRQAKVVRLETSASGAMDDFMVRALAVSPEAVVRRTSWMDLKGVAQLAAQPGFDALRRAVWEPSPVADFEGAPDLWEVLRQKDVLVQHPYESFDAVNRFLEAAAEDANVLAIKQTLYRTGPDSGVLRALERAAGLGKQVTVLVELKARFDEESNIEWARRLQAAGATVLYGVVGLKTHAKACLVVRREPGGIQRYAHLSTGNYNERTARVYSDIGYFTAREGLTGEIAAFFNMITGYSQPAAFQKIDVAPYTLRRKLLRLIRREILRHTPNRPGLIMAKLNSLADPEIIQALYDASRAGVPVRLNVRGICCLRPGVPGLSETIEVVSIVDQFLEHARILYFANGGEEEIYLTSADALSRNLDRRIELQFPVEDPESKRKLMDILKLYFRDNVKAWRLQPDGAYVRVESAGKRRFRVQQELCERAHQQAEAGRKKLPRDLKPQRPLREPTPPS